MNLISLEKNPEIKVNQKLERFLNPDCIEIPFENMINIPKKYVYKDETIFNNTKSTISGIIKGYKKYCNKNKILHTLFIENDFREMAENKKAKPDKIDIKNLIKILKDNNELNLYHKLINNNSIKNIVISAINDEPYVYNNIIILKENIKEILELIDELGIYFKADNIYLIVKNNEANIINDCLNELGTYPNIKLTLVNDEYLIGRKEFIFEKLKLDSNSEYWLIEEIYNMTKYIFGKDNTTKIITISGDAIESGKVLEVKKYCLLDEIIKKYIKINEPHLIIVNGLMGGYEISDSAKLIITDEIFSINIMKKAKIKDSECIKCGKCISICPIKINPLEKSDYHKCIDCGLCSYICPANINLRKFIKDSGEKNE